jgi:hypothetical protein
MEGYNNDLTILRTRLKQLERTVAIQEGGRRPVSRSKRQELKTLDLLQALELAL